jgi:hypothetical protein
MPFLWMGGQMIWFLSENLENSDFQVIVNVRPMIKSRVMIHRKFKMRVIMIIQLPDDVLEEPLEIILRILWFFAIPISQYCITRLHYK